MPRATDAITAIPGIQVGHYTDLEHATGCTVVLFEEGAVGSVDIRGGAPGTRETDLLRPGNLVERVHAVVLSGGSAYGLDAASGVACAIEKHFTLSRADKGPDSEFSIEPEELERLCSDTRDAWAALGRAGYARQPAEEGSKVFRRSIYFVRDLPAGAVVTPEDIRRIRPGMGLTPKYFDELVGRRLKTAVTRGMATAWEVFED